MGKVCDYNVGTAHNREPLIKARIVQVGNSRGIRLPKALLEEAQLSDEVECRLSRGAL